MSNILLSLCLLALFQSWAGAIFGGHSYGELTSDHSLYYVGENITLHCKKFSPFDGSAVFKAKNDIVPSEYVTANSTYARMEKTATEDHPARLIYTCRDDTVSLIGEQVLNVEYRPQKPQDLRPEWYNRDTLRLSWNLGLEAYKIPPGIQNNRVTEVTASYSTDGSDWRACPLLTNTSCEVENFRVTLVKVYFVVRVKNKVRGDSENATLNINPINDYEKPAAVEQLEAVPVNSTCVVLTWRVFSVELGALVSLGLEGQPLDREQQVSEDVTSATVCDLHPAYTYKFEVRATPRKGYPSEPKSRTLKMPDDVPARGPRVSRAGYSRSSCNADEMEDLTVYFQPTEKDHQNGNITAYSAVFELDGWRKDISKSPSEDMSFKDMFFKEPVPCRSALNVTLYANTSAGKSPPSVLHVPSPSDVAGLVQEVERMDLRVEKKNDSQVKVFWNGTSQAPDYTLLLYYCYSKENPGQNCKDADGLKHLEVNPTHNVYELDATGTAGFNNPQFGLAAVDKNGQGSGVTFTKCVYTVGTGAPDPAPERPTATAQESRIQLSWSANRCDGNRIVWHYVIKICPSRGATGDECSEIVVNGKISTYLLEDVVPRTEYVISLAINSSSSPHLTAFSEPVFATPLASSDSSLKTVEILGIALAVLIVVLVLGCLLFCKIRSWCRRQRKMAINIDKAVNGIVPKHTRPPELPPRNDNNNSDDHIGYDNPVYTADVKPGLKQPQKSNTDSGYGGHSPPNTPDEKKVQQNSDYLLISQVLSSVPSSGNGSMVVGHVSSPPHPPCLGKLYSEDQGKFNPADAQAASSTQTTGKQAFQPAADVDCNLQNVSTSGDDDITKNGSHSSAHLTKAEDGLQEDHCGNTGNLSSYVQFDGMTSPYVRYERAEGGIEKVTTSLPYLSNSHLPAQEDPPIPASREKVDDAETEQLNNLQIVDEDGATATNPQTGLDTGIDTPVFTPTLQQTTEAADLTSPDRDIITASREVDSQIAKKVSMATGYLPNHMANSTKDPTCSAAHAKDPAFTETSLNSDGYVARVANSIPAEPGLRSQSFAVQTDDRPHDKSSVGSDGYVRQALNPSPGQYEPEGFVSGLGEGVKQMACQTEPPVLPCECLLVNKNPLTSQSVQGSGYVAHASLQQPLPSLGAPSQEKPRQHNSGYVSSTSPGSLSPSSPSPAETSQHSKSSSESPESLHADPMAYVTSSSPSNPLPEEAANIEQMQKNFNSEPTSSYYTSHTGSVNGVVCDGMGNEEKQNVGKFQRCDSGYDEHLSPTGSQSSPFSTHPHKEGEDEGKSSSEGEREWPRPVPGYVSFSPC